MKIHQRDIIEVNYLFPDGTNKPHMAIVVSNDELQEIEGFFYLAMISSKNYNPQYTYPLDNEMPEVSHPCIHLSYPYQM